MNIPSEAHTAAREAEYDWNAATRPTLSRVEYMLRAAAPFIAAQALRDAAHQLDAWVGPSKVNAEDVIADLRLNADRLDPQ